MTNKIIVEPLEAVSTFNKRFEIVERKGVGHPDTICDLVMDRISVELSKFYMKRFGMVLHHNLDKALLVAGQSKNMFGGGSVLKPMRFIFGDRATLVVNSDAVPVEEIATETASSWFEKKLRFVKKEHVEYKFEIGWASQQLQAIFKDHKKSIGANDTSALVGYAPLTKAETAVLETEFYVNSKEFKSEFPESGEDVKVMGFRDGNSIDLTIAMAFIDAYVSSDAFYFQRKNEMLQAIEEFHKRKGYFDKVNVTMNNLDQEKKGIEGLYLTVLGTSADSSDSGQVGRGNRANQVVSLMRPAGSEAAAGKNAVSHIGKIYNILCFKLAEDIYANVDGIQEVFVWMYNVIGKPVDKPRAVVIQPIAKDKREIERLSKEIKVIVDENLAKMNDFCKSLIL
ncbi:MAG: methionine adenosyltransferase [Nitrososphaerales archaeon]